MHKKDQRADVPDMQHRHFRYIAQTLRRLKMGERFPDGSRLSPSDADNVATFFSHVLNATNPNFDRFRFLEACGTPTED